MRHSLPVIDRFDPIDRIEIPIPCHVPWDTMAGNERVRHCGTCRQNVYEIASLTREEALQLLQKNGGSVCVRIYRRPDGTVITNDCRARLRAARRRGLLVFIGVALVVLWAQISAQVVGLIGLRRVLGRDGSGRGGVQGEAPMVVRPPVVRVPDPEPMTGTPLPTPIQLRETRKLMGKMVPPPAKHLGPLAGRVRRHDLD